MCGAPRIDTSEKLPGETLKALREADESRYAASAQQTWAWGFGVIAAFVAVLAMMLEIGSVILALALLGVAFVIAIPAARAAYRATTFRRRARSALDRAWRAAVVHLLEHQKTPAEIALALCIAEGEVDAMLAAPRRDG